jgi:hypothetical protein
MKTLEYYFETGKHLILDKYTIDKTGVVINKNSGKTRNFSKSGKYNTCGVQDNYGKTYTLLIGRAIASTFCGPPPTLKHTADHIDRDPTNDTLENIRWLCKSGQRENQHRNDTYKSAFIVVYNGVEKTVKDWVIDLKFQRNRLGREYTDIMINKYSQKNVHGFSYKKYPDLFGEVWKEIRGSNNYKGRWEISNMNRVKYVTKYAENVLYGDRLRSNNGYPTIKINDKQLLCHVLSFMTFFPDDYAAMKPDEMILHEDDDKMDFRPHKLRLGTRNDNILDAYKNDKYTGTKTAMMKCVSYINGVLEKEHDSQHDAVRYLKKNGVDKARNGEISVALKAFRNGKVITRYGRTWTL